MSISVFDEIPEALQGKTFFKTYFCFGCSLIKVVKRTPKCFLLVFKTLGILGDIITAQSQDKHIALHTKRKTCFQVSKGYVPFQNHLLSRGEYMSKKAETVYPEIWGILKLRGLINKKILKTVSKLS